MAPFNVVFTVTIFYCLTYFANAFLLDPDCFVPQPCTCIPTGVDCTGMDLDMVPLFDPVDWNTTYLSLHLDNNNISMIGDNAFLSINVDNMTDIDLFLQDNSISSLSRDCFNGIGENFNIVNLTNNELTSLSRVFGNKTRMRHLYLDNNPLRTLDAFTMNELGRQLETLDIDMSDFVSWPTELHYLRHLYNLFLHNIQFNSLHYDAFKGFEDTLINLSILDSNLEELPIAICHLTRLNKLIFENNDKLVGGMLHVEECHRDSLSGNRMMYIGFRNNSLVEFPHVIKTGTSYRVVDLGENKLRFVEHGLIPKCRISALNLDHNKLSRIPYDINNVDGLTVLDMGFNEIQSIEDPDLANLSQLYRLVLRNNQIQYVSNNAFANNVNIVELDLSNNNLKTIPEALIRITSLSTLGFSGNTMDCSCLEFNPSSWNYSPITISGYCEFGLETVQHFLSTHPFECP